MADAAKALKLTAARSEAPGRRRRGHRGAHRRGAPQSAEMFKRLRDRLEAHFAELAKLSIDDLLPARYEKFRQMGTVFAPAPSSRKHATGRAEWGWPRQADRAIGRRDRTRNPAPGMLSSRQPPRIPVPAAAASTSSSITRSRRCAPSSIARSTRRSSRASRPRGLKLSPLRTSSGSCTGSLRDREASPRCRCREPGRTARSSSRRRVPLG